MPKLTLSKLVELAGEHARNVLIDKHEPHLMASYLLHGPDASKVIGCIWRNFAEKELVIADVKRHSRAMRATMASFVTEAWAVERPLEIDPTQVIPSEEPDRREYVIACATDGKRTESRTWQIVRDRPGGAIIALFAADEKSQGQIGFNRMLDGIIG
jgi:hypothetical protein